MRLVSSYVLTVWVTAASIVDASGQLKCGDATVLLGSLQSNHVQPPAIDQQFSSRVLNLFTNELDPQHLYFSRVQAEKILGFPLKLETGNNVCELVAVAGSLLSSQLNDYKSFLNLTLKQPLNFNAPDFFHYQVIAKKSPFDDAETLRKNRIRW